MPRAFKPLRWTIDRAAGEFGLDRKTLANRIRESGILPGEDKMFSTAAICRAVFSDSEAARTALAISQRENYDLKNLKLAEKLANTSLFQTISDSMVLILRQKITDAPMPEDVKLGILKEIQNIDVNEVVKQNPTADDSGLEE